VPVGDPNVISVAFIGSLSANFDALYRDPGADDSFDDLFDLICNLRNGFPNRTSNVSGD
jgi:hypothetical protein